MANEFAFETLVEAEPLSLGPFTVTPFRVNHPVEAYGFRVEADGRAGVQRRHRRLPALSPLFTGADLVLADAAFVDGRDAARASTSPAAGPPGPPSTRAGAAAHADPHPRVERPRAVPRAGAAVWPGEVELAVPDTTYAI